MRVRFLLFIFILVALAVVGCVTNHPAPILIKYHPCPLGTGKITGTITDRLTGGPVVGADISVVGYRNCGTMSDSIGRYIFDGMFPNCYTLLITTPWHRSSELFAIEVIENDTAIRDIALERGSWADSVEGTPWETAFYRLDSRWSPGPSQGSLELMGDWGGEIEGIVLDRTTGDPISSVSVLLVGRDEKYWTDRDGNFKIAKIAPFSYTLRFISRTHEFKEVSLVPVISRATTRLEVVMKRRETPEGDMPCAY